MIHKKHFQHIVKYLKIQLRYHHTVPFSGNRLLKPGVDILRQQMITFMSRDTINNAVINQSLGVINKEETKIKPSSSIGCSKRRWRDNNNLRVGALCHKLTIYKQFSSNNFIKSKSIINFSDNKSLEKPNL